jgi:hypothetical protein
VEAREPIDELVVRDENLGLGEVQRVLEERAARGEVQRRVDGAGRVCAEPGAEDVRARRHPRRDVVAHLHAEALEAVAGAPRLAHRVGPRPLRLLEEDEGLVGLGLGAGEEQVGDDALLARRERELGSAICGGHGPSNLLTELKSLKLIRVRSRCQTARSG